MRVGREKAAEVAGVAVALALVAVVAVLAARSDGTNGSAARDRTTPRSPATAVVTSDYGSTVRTAVMRYIDAYDDAFRTGDSAGLVQLTVPGSRARGDSGVPRQIVTGNHTTFVVVTVKIVSLTASAFTTSASASADYDVDGYDASWPSLARSGDDRMVHVHHDYDLALLNGTWLVEDVR